MKKRIWELDAFRGIMMIAIMAYHLLYDLVYLFFLMKPDTPFLRNLFEFCNDWLGLPFLFLSGLSVTLGSRPIHRGIQVLCGGALISLVTTMVYLLDFADRSMIIYFGVLHCLGCCMLLWPLLRKLPKALLPVLGVVFIGVGFYFRSNLLVDFPWLISLGLTPPGFSSSDYFPLLPNLGYFLIGAFVGLTLYRKKQSLFPGVSPKNILVRPFIFIGRHSLLFYLLHQPVLVGAVALWVTLF